jgi:N-acetylmuramoyl-L-alanine amidase
MSVNFLRTFFAITLLLGPFEYHCVSHPTIIIDAGHGGKDDGCKNNLYKLTEKQLTLNLAYALRHKLKEKKLTTYLTRTNDTFVSLKKRCEISNNISNAIFVSIHLNSCDDNKITGTEVFFYPTKFKNKYRCSNYLAKCVCGKLTNNINSKNRGVKKANFTVIKHTKHPSILVECEFLSNDDIASKFKQRAYTEKIADGIANGILDYLKVYP